MKISIKRFLQSIGSVMDIQPNTDYGRYIDKGTDEEIIRDDWIAVGKYLKQSINKYSLKK